MTQSIFATGISQSIADVLANKDQRVQSQRQLAKRYSDQTIVTLKLNIPGPIKNNDALTQIFEKGKNIWQVRLNQEQFVVTEVQQWNKETGCESLMVIDGSAQRLKQFAVRFEDETPLGRLFDVDVLVNDGQRLQALSRTQLNLPVRQCFICGRSAKACARSRRHSIEELQGYINNVYHKTFGKTL
ncbi:citrate lyase holo-[acyl-carrier protein] synthase [Furfurilactobacillus curtus]|uniref:citrate lyase holo-[acyl-carrier protein] synthase n=1 Tax=Furfurilactobacillus curtus TaxID=1746200 RepID=A0ABQ5JKU8_9LACO